MRVSIGRKYLAYARPHAAIAGPACELVLAPMNVRGQGAA